MDYYHEEKKYCLFLDKHEITEILDALFLASREWGEPSATNVGIIAMKLRAVLSDAVNIGKCNDIVYNVIRPDRNISNGG